MDLTISHFLIILNDNVRCNINSLQVFLPSTNKYWSWMVSVSRRQKPSISWNSSIIMRYCWRIRLKIRSECKLNIFSSNSEILVHHLIQ